MRIHKYRTDAGLHLGRARTFCGREVWASHVAKDPKQVTCVACQRVFAKTLRELQDALGAFQNRPT